MELAVSVTVTMTGEDGSQCPVGGELAAALAAPAEQFASMLTWAAGEAGGADHGDREQVIAESGRELQRRLLEATFTIDAGCEERIEQVTSAAGIRHGTVEKGHDRGVISIFGPVRATRLAYRNRREANLYPADARWMLPDDPYSLGMRALAAYHLAGGGYGQAQEVIEARTGVKIGPAQLAGLAQDPAGGVDDFYAWRASGADTALPYSDVIMMQADGKGIAMRPEHRASAGKETSAAHPGIKKMAEIVAVAAVTPAAREPGDIAAPPARRKEHPGPKARDKWVSASITGDIPGTIGTAFDEADRRDPYRTRQRIFLVDGNKQQIAAIGDHARDRGLKVPVFIDYIHVSGYIGKAAAALHPGLRRRQDPQQPPHPPPRPHRRRQGRHLPDEQPHAHALRQGTGGRLADRHRHDRGSLPLRHRRQIRDHRGQMVPRRRRSHPQAPRRGRQRRPGRLHELLQDTLPQRHPPDPLRPGQHPQPRPHRMTGTS